MRVLYVILFVYLTPINVFCQSNKIDYFKNLNSKERNVIVDKGTESPYTGKYNSHFEEGTYHCKACDNPLYKSVNKFESNCGWPAFDDQIKGAIIRYSDYKLGYKRTEDA